MFKLTKKLITALVSASLLVSAAAPAYAAEQATVFVNFNCAGQISGQTVPVGSNVVAPAAPVCAGFTFCGFDKSLRNVTANTTYTAIYVSNELGQAAIDAKKASLPTPAITATTVANPNMVAAPAVQAPVAQAPVVQAPAAQPAAVQAPAQNDQAAIQAALAQLLAQIQAQQAAAAQAAAAQAQQAAAVQPQADAAQAQQPQADAAAQTQQPQADAAAQTQPAVEAPAAPAVAPAPVAVGVPSWVVGLEGVDAAGAATAYNYLKNTKGLDDGTIQANWGSFMHHYAGHGVVGW